MKRPSAKDLFFDPWNFGFKNSSVRRSSGNRQKHKAVKNFLKRQNVEKFIKKQRRRID